MIWERICLVSGAPNAEPHRKPHRRFGSPLTLESFWILNIRTSGRLDGEQSLFCSKIFGSKQKIQLRYIIRERQRGYSQSAAREIMSQILAFT